MRGGEALAPHGRGVKLHGRTTGGTPMIEQGSPAAAVQRAKDRGIVFPEGPDGGPSSRHAGARIVAAALAAIDPDHAEDARRERRWRHAYPLHFRRLVEDSMRSRQVALASARAGLTLAWGTLRWEAGGASCSLHDALALPTDPLASVNVRGHGDPRPAALVVPYRGELLQGEALAAQIDDWLARGIIEPSAAQALHRCLRHAEWFDLSDRTMVLLGAGSEAGPLRWLSRWRARIVAVDVPGEPVWRRIGAIVADGNGVLVAPVRGRVRAVDEDGGWVADAGVDLLTEAPRAAAWICAQPGPLDVAALGYLDGERHVRLSLAMDMVQAAAARDPRASMAWMATPTDVFAVPATTARRAQEAYAQRPPMQRAWQAPLRLASGDRLFNANVERIEATGEGLEYGLVDSLIVEQGPNYALAKRLQQWRAVIAREAGHRVCLNVAPSTSTASVLKNPAFAAGFAGADAFGIEVFEPATTTAIMAALWVHDLRADESAANPARPLAHPFELFMDNACHGGLWTSAYRARSALPMAAVIGWLRGPKRARLLAAG